MPNTVLIGAQWGDEGKGKVIDVLTEDVDIVVRYQGGNNAGHTIVAGDQTYALQIWATAVSFALVFRGNLAYGRFWEGRIQIAKFSSYMQDTALMCVCFDEANKNMNQYREWKQVRR